ncbi:MAG: hypothetical protein JXO22_06900, partial [Phycisphaerae bacterium]|nr:hypothetical protein [Phycisphaerae bacterium]
PQMYGAGTSADQQLFAQHDARWIPKGMPGAGHIMVFNNGRGRVDGSYSSVDEIVPPVADNGSYRIENGAAFGPSKPAWTYRAENRREFFAGHISGAQRLDNGNTLICDGERSRVFEVTTDGEVVWDYACTMAGNMGPRGFLGRMFGGPGRDGDRRPGRPPAGDDADDGNRIPGGNGDRVPGSAADHPREDGDNPHSTARGWRDNNADRPMPGRRGGGPPGGFMHPPGGMGGPGGLFRATRVSPSHPGLAGKDLSPKVGGARPQEQP